MKIRILSMIKTFQQLFRLFQINLIIAKYGLDRVILPKNHVGYYLTYLNPWNWGRRENRDPVQIRVALEKLGPIFVKFGQVLSTRRDLIPRDIADELTKLQDKVPPFPFDEVKSILEKAYNAPLETVFTELDPVPLASASIAQVHAAQLGERSVVVKVLRPNIQKLIAHDVSLLSFIAKLIQWFLPRGSGLNLPDLVAEFKQTLSDELDLVREGANASKLRRHFLHSDLLYIPQVFWEYTHQPVLVMERIQGIPIYNIAALKSAHVPLKALAEQGIELFFTQVFRDSFFHADMHPGNIFVSYDGGYAQYIFVDFGIVGTLDRKDQYYIAENLMAFLERDYRRVADLHRESGWLKEGADLRQFEAAIRTACEPVFEKPLKDISLAQVLIRLFQTARRFNIQIQPQLLLLQKTLFNLEGMTRALYPDLDFWGVCRPFLEYWMKQKHHPVYLLKKIEQRAPYWLESFIEATDKKLVKTLMSSQSSSEQQVPKKERKSIFVALGLGFMVSALYFYFFEIVGVDQSGFALLTMIISGVFFTLVGLLIG